MSTKKLLKYWAIFSVNRANERVYLANWAARFSGITLRLWIFSQLYKATFVTAGAEKVNGLTVGQVIWVLAMTQCFGIITGASVERVVGDEVKTGEIAYQLNRPCSYILLHYFAFLGKATSFLIESIVAGTLVYCILVGVPDVTVVGVVTTVILLIFGATLHFLITISIGMLAFWTEEISPFWWIYHKAYVILGGMLIPPELFTEYWKKITEKLPFSLIFYSAGRASISSDISVFLEDLSMQIIWIVVFLILAIGLYRTGTQRVSINGG